MAEIFISYKSERRKAAGHLAKILERYGYTVWFDYHLVKGDDFADEIDKRIRAAKAVVVLWCKLGVQSVWVKREAALAAKLKILVPATIEPCDLRVDFDSDHNTDLSEWSGAPLDHKLYPLLDGIAHRVGRPPQLDFKAMRDYEEDWRRFGAPSLKAFALEEPVKAEEPRPVPPAPLPHAPAPAERDWERFGIAASEDLEEIEAYIKQYEASEPLWAVKAKKRLAVVEALLRERKAEEDRQRAEELARREEAARTVALKRAEEERAEAERRYRAEGRIRVPAAFVRPGGLEWFLPGSGKAEGFEDLDIGPEMVVLPATKEFFWMGSKDNEGDADERPRHKVKIRAPFAVGKYPVTVAEYMAGVKAGGCKPPEWLEKGSQYNIETGSDDHYKQLGDALKGDRFPIVGVSWDDAKAYAAWLASKTGKAYRLLSEAEWEYACRAGTESAYAFGGDESQLDRYAWYSSNSGGKTHPVGEKLANEWGLHDMHGNVWEWCEDPWHGNYIGAPEDGLAWTTGGLGFGVLRGGAFVNDPRALRSAYRFSYDLGNGDRFRGFRVARTL